MFLSGQPLDTNTHPSQSYLLQNVPFAAFKMYQRLKIDGVTSIELKFEKYLNKKN